MSIADLAKALNEGRRSRHVSALAHDRLHKDGRSIFGLRLLLKRLLKLVQCMSNENLFGSVDRQTERVPERERSCEYAWLG